MNIKFSGQGLAFLSHYVAEHDIRYYLTGVYLRPMPAEAGGGVLGAASNGHVMGLWHDKDGQIDRPAILRITPELVRACGGKVGRKTGDPMLTVLDSRLACVVGDAEVYIQPNELQEKGGKLKATEGMEPWEIVGKFPDVGRVLPNLAEANRGPDNLINANYLKLFAKSLPRSDKWGASAVLRQAGKDAPILGLSPRVPQAAVVIMPMRDSESELAPPTWLDRFKRHEQRAKDATSAPLPVHEPSDAGPPDSDFRAWDLVERGAV